jgi:hypothetical protein
MVYEIADKRFYTSSFDILVSVIDSGVCRVTCYGRCFRQSLNW